MAICRIHACLQGWRTGFQKCLRGLIIDYLAKKFKKRSEFHNRDTRNKNNKIDIPGYKLRRAKDLSGQFPTVDTLPRKTLSPNKF